MNPPSFRRTFAALVVYDAGAEERAKAWERADDAEALDRALGAERAAEDRVREAFFLDTCQVNSRDNAFLVHPDDPWLRALIARCSGPPDYLVDVGEKRRQTDEEVAKDFDRQGIALKKPVPDTARRRVPLMRKVVIVPHDVVVATMTAKADLLFGELEMATSSAFTKDGRARFLKSLFKALTESWAEGYAAGREGQ